MNVKEAAEHATNEYSDSFERATIWILAGKHFREGRSPAEALRLGKVDYDQIQVSEVRPANDR